MTMELDDTQRAAVESLLDQAEEAGCLNVSAVASLVGRLDLDDEAQSQIEDEARRRGLEMTDDCGRQSIAATSYSTASSPAPRPTRSRSSCARCGGTRCSPPSRRWSSPSASRTATRRPR